MAAAVVAARQTISAQSAIAFVQVKSATPQTPSTSVAVVYTAAQTAGNLNVVVVGWNDATAQVQTVSDSRGNTYQRAVGPTIRAGSATQTIYYAANIAAAPANGNTVTVTFAPAAAFADIRIAEYRGIATVNPVDVTLGASGSSASSDSGAVVTTNANDLIVGANMVQTKTTGPGASYTSRVITSPDGDILEDRIVTTIGSYNAAAPIWSGWWVMQMVAFRAAGAAAPDTQPPTPPGTPVATVVSNGQINLTWPVATDNVSVTGYRVERCAGVGCTTFAQVGTPTAASFSDTGLTGSTTYNYRVRATDAAGNLSAYSAVAVATTPAAPDTQPPTAPGAPVPTVVSSSQIDLTWPVATDNVGVSGYRVERCTGAGCTTFAQIGTPVAAGFSDTGLTGSTTYRYRVRATDAAGNLSAYSAVATATTPTPPDTQAPTTPGAPVMSVVSSSQLNLTWQAATDNIAVTGYLVERCTGIGCTMFAQVGAPATTILSDTGLAASTSYSYRVRATDAAGNVSGFSSVATATTQVPPDTQPPTAPGTPVPIVMSSSQIDLTWPAATDNVAVTGYLVERCAGVGCTTFAQVGTPTAASFSDTGLTGSTTYSYRVRATDAAGNLSAYSAIATVTTQASSDTQAPTAPGTPVPNVTSSSQVDLTWPAATDNVAVTGYLVERCAGAGCGTFTQVGTPAAANFSDTGLGGSTSYSYRVRATDAAGNLSAYSVVATATTQAPPDTQPPTAPGTPVTTVVSSSQIDLTWPAATDNVAVTGYLVERCAGGGCTTFVQVGTPATTSFTDSGLTAATSYTYRVRATDAATNPGPYSSISSAITQGPPDTQTPTAPANLTAVAFGGGQINLNWTASTDNVGVTAYRVEQCLGAGCTTFTEIGTASVAPITVPLTPSANPNYFKDASGKPLILSGSHTWNTFQDWGSNGVVQTLDFPAFVNFLVAHGHNFTDLWRIELPQLCGFPTSTGGGTTFTIGTHPWQRTGPGSATDGKATFDLTKFDQSYFDRLRARTQALNAAGIYAGVYLFTAEFLIPSRCATDGYPFTGSNNVNGIDDGGGTGSVTMTAPNAITAFQDAYVEKVIDTLNDLPNVLWLVSEEALASKWWNDHQISHVRSYELGRSLQHPIGYGSLTVEDDSKLYSSIADFVNPIAPLSPTTSCGTGTPPCKVNINDSDHSMYGMWNNTAQQNRNYAWENFTNGNQVVFMDPYVVYYPREGRNLCPSPTNGICSGPDPRWDNFRDNLGAILKYSRRLNLTFVTPNSSLCSTNNCLAQTPAVGAEYLIYAPNGGAFTVNLSAMSSARTLNVEWFNPSTGATIAGGAVPAGSSRSFTPPFSGDAVLYLVDSTGHAGPVSTPGTSYTVTGLASGPYGYRVRAIDAAGNLSLYSNVATATIQGSDTQPPTAPGTPVPTPASSTQINLTWPVATDNVGVTGYLVERCAGTGCTTFVQVGTPATASFTDTGLTASTRYSYRVSATDAANNLGPYSATASATTQAPPDTQPPTAPGTPVPTVMSITQINLTWPVAADNVGVTGYFVERCAGAGCTTFVQVGTPATASFTDSGLTAATSYSYRVRATDAANNLGPYSATATATTQTPDSQPPTAPGTPVPTVMSITQINLTWPVATDNVGIIGYLIERCAGAGCTTFVQVGTPSAASFTDSGLAAATSYSYRVRATDAANNLGPYSATATATTQNADTQPPTAPGTPILTVGSNSQINLTWAAATDDVGVTGYLVERCAGTGCITFTQVGTPATTSLSDSSLSASTSYSYRVRARDAATNVGPYSAAASATTFASAVITLVQHTSKNAGTVTSSTLAFPANNTAGNWLAVAVRATPAAQTFTITDTRGNTYRQAVQLSETVDTATIAIFYAENISGGANTITVRNSQSGGLRFAIMEYSGVALVNSIDRMAATQGSSKTPSSGSVTTTSDGDLVLAMIGVPSATTFTAGSGFTIQERVTASSATLAVEDRTLATAGSVAAAATLNANRTWGTAVATFHAASAGPPPPPDLTIVKSHTGSFVQGQVGATYTLTVTNSGAGPTAAAVTVTDTLPAELTATAIAGTNWNCTQPAGPCTRSDTLATGASYPPIVLTVNVASTAPASVINSASVGGGGETNSANDTANDVTTITLPDTQPPSAPGLLTAVAPNGTHVALSWGPATDNVGVADYRVERCDGVCVDVGFVRIAVPTGTTFSDSGLTPNTTYSYIVRAEDGASNLGPYSNVATVTTLSNIPELIAAYAFDEGTGTTVTDQSGNARTGTILNATWNAAGRYGKALQFNGTNAKVSIPDAAAFHLTTGMTLEAWVNPSAVSSAWRDIIYKGNDNFYLMGTTTPSGMPAGGGTFGGTNVNLMATSTLPVNTWTHLTATYDGAMLRFYVNGAPVASVAQTGALTSSTNPLEIGGDAIFGQFFNGLIDEVRIYNIALAPSQIQADMLKPLAAITPVLSFNPATADFGSRATGSSSAAQTVTISNAGNAAMAISSIGFGGANPGDFSQTNTCSASLAPLATCNVSITFTPVAIGLRNATLSVADNAPGTPHTVALTGTGTGFSVAPRVSVLTPNLSQQFSTTGTSNGTPVWAVDGVEAGGPATGTITPAGLYTPPASQGTHIVSYTDAARSSSATVYVTAYPGVFTHHNDNARTGQNVGEIALMPSNVNSGTFGKLFSYTLDGLSMASPLYVAGVNIPGQGMHNVVYVVTQHNSVYAFDADGLSAAPLWQKSFLDSSVTAVPASDTGECCDIAPEIGITGTPVIDPVTGTLYVVAKTKEGTTTYRQQLHALDIATGTEKFGGPVLIQASAPGSGQGSSGGVVPFDALHENQRPALLLANGVVYIAFGSHGDVQPYHGWVLGYNALTLQQTMAVNLSPDDSGAGIWLANGGPAADAAGNLYVVTGNGLFDTSNTNRRNYGDSIVKIGPSGVILDFFTPHDQGTMNANNFDLGAAGVMLLPDQTGSHPHVMVSGGKNNTVYVVDRDNMGKYNASNDSQIVQSLIDIFPFGSPEPGNYSAPVYFNGTVYFGPIRDNVQAFRLTSSLLTNSPTSVTTDIFNYPGATLAISANGSSNGILWAIQRNGDCGVLLTCSSASPGVLKAYDASNLGILLYGSDQAVGGRDTLDYATKFSVPLVANGKVFVASMSKLIVYGLLP